MVWGHLLGTALAQGGTCRLELLGAEQENWDFPSGEGILGMELQSSDLGQPAVEDELHIEGFNSTFPLLLLLPLGVHR